MKVANLKAESNPRGSRIDLVWSNPDAPEFRGVKILRREAAYPELPADLGSSVVIHDEPAGLANRAGAVRRFSDRGLKSETVYYYAVAAYDGSPAHFPAFVSAMATGAYQSAETMYRNLPALYQRFDSLLPPDAPSLDPSSRNSGQLRRLIEMFGEQFDLLRSFASGTRDFSSVDRIDGELLPLRAGWIGWQTDFTSPLHKQRNEIKYAPSYFRTTGIVANLRATLNRLTTWDPQVKEFVHNIFLSNAAEQLTIHETERAGVTWQPAKLVTLDVAYEGRPAALNAADGRSWLFYHARETVPRTRSQAKGTEDRWHLWYKINDQDEWLASRRITFSGSINKYPCAVERADGSFLVFWSSLEGENPEAFHHLRLRLLAAGRAAQPPRLRTETGPFSFADGARFYITNKHGLTSIDRTVTFHSEHFRNIAAATANEVAALLDSEIPGVEVTAADDGTIVITSATPGAASTLTVAASPVAVALGLVAPNASRTGSDATHAQLTASTAGSFTLDEGESLAIRVDGGPERLITFSSSRIPNLASISANVVAAAINDVLPGLAQARSNRIRLMSPTAGDASSIAVEVLPSSIAEESAARFILPVESTGHGLGFGAPLPPQPPNSDDIEPAVCNDNSGNTWLFWSSRRSGVWKIWYNRFDGNSWGVSQQLTTGIIADREPAVVFDPGTAAPGSGTIWVFWSRKNAQGLWNIFYGAAANLSFPLAVSAETELAPVPPDRDRREPAPLLLGPNDIELFFSSNGTDGWQVWSKKINSVTPVSDAPITAGQFTQRAPAVLQTADGGLRLLYRSNESRSYTSAVYPSARTLDSRYAGSTTVDTRNAAKIGLQGAIDDVQRYTYDARRVDDARAPGGREEEEPPVWYARDTIGIYLTPDTTDEGLIIRSQRLIESALRSFLPIQLRVVFIVREAVSDFVYTYSRTGAGPQHLIGEQTIDTLLSDVLGSITDSFVDRLKFRFMRSWDGIHPNTPLPDFSVSPPAVSSRLFLNGEEGE